MCSLCIARQIKSLPEFAAKMEVTIHGGTKPSLGEFRVVYASGLCEERLSWEEVIASQLRSVIKSSISLGGGGLSSG